MIKIYHESPTSIFKRVQDVTDGDYALVHLFEENEVYFQQFVEAVEDGREVILDNSIFELGTAFDADRFAEWVLKLKPTYYIIPDVLEDAQGTIDNYENWVQKYPNLPGKTMAVAQGNTYEEFKRCYQYLVGKVDKICISFDYCFFNDWLKNCELPTKYHEWMFGRQILLTKMRTDGILREDVPHHLLGVGLPQEYAAYRDYKFIDSLDTSNPVVHGILDIPYEYYGLDDKKSTKLFTLVDTDVEKHWPLISKNIDSFYTLIYGGL